MNILIQFLEVIFDDILSIDDLEYVFQQPFQYIEFKIWWY